MNECDGHEEENVNNQSLRNFKSPSPSESSDSPDIDDFDLPMENTGPPPTPPFQTAAPYQNDRPRRHNMGVPHPKYADYEIYTAWSATKSQLEELNKAINNRYSG